MSSGDSEAPPTYYFSGILFNPSFYSTTSSTYLTQTTAKKYFLSYPSAQGTETISNLISTSINYTSPLTGSFFDIGTNQVSGGTIRVGPTGGSAGVSVHCGNLDFKNNTINNATSGTSGDLSIASAQTQGVLNIATASRIKTSGTSNGDINIGTGINTLASGTIYPYINIGNNPSTLNGTQISMGAVNTTTTINGTTNISSLKTTSIDTASGGTMAIGASSTGGITLGAGNASTTVAGSLTSSGQIIANAGISVGSNNSIFTTFGQQLRLGYANTQTTGSSTSSFGPFFKSFGPDAVTSSTYTILFEGANGLFSSVGVDGCGGLLTIFIKSGGGRFATYLYTVVKRSLATTYAGMQGISLNASLWTTNPAVSASGNNLAVAFGGTEWSGATVSWSFLGSV